MTAPLSRSCGFSKPDFILVGAGQMARALVRGWGEAPPFETLYSVDPHQKEGFGGPNTRHVSAPQELPPLTRPFVLLFAVKPQILPELLPLWKDIASRASLVFSIAAGISCATLQQGLGCPVIRLMPNIPVAVGSGIVGYYTPDVLEGEKKNLLHQCLAPLGLKVPVDSEDDLNRITAFSGSGPAYVYAFLEALEEAALSLNLPAELAAAMAQTLVRGSVMLKEDSAESPATLRQAVTSKGGTTEAALSVLMDPIQGLFPLMKKTVKASYDRSQVLAGDEWG